MKQVKNQNLSDAPKAPKALNALNALKAPKDYNGLPYETIITA